MWSAHTGSEGGGERHPIPGHSGVLVPDALVHDVKSVVSSKLRVKSK